MQTDSTIAAIATAPGMGAIAVIRLSGPESVEICEKVFVPERKGKLLSKQKAYTIHYGSIVENGNIIDKVLVSLFRAPHSYTGDDMVEISCHGSPVIQQQILEILVNNGAQLAKPGEFTLRAFLNGKMDLSQAEAVADLIASTSESGRRVAMQQMRGGFTNELQLLREKLLTFISLIELELDFGEEDVEFADRTQLSNLVEEIDSKLGRLLDSFKLGNVIKKGIPVTIAGKPNVGKSTLLNRLLNEERAIVSDIAGTTRDTIEDVMVINGTAFRFIDTAGLRHTTDTVESMGIERAYSKISEALVVLMMLDTRDEVEQCVKEVRTLAGKLTKEQKMILLLNKIDLAGNERVSQLEKVLSDEFSEFQQIPISAKHSQHIDKLVEELASYSKVKKSDGDEVIVTNIRHYESLLRAHENILRVNYGLKSQIPTDLIAMDIRQVLHYLGEITGEITTDEVLGSIFSKFCIGK